ncbi:MAG TPA: hypothetical protein PLE45_10065 [Spirochaetota bacterium]|nr:hypothetical protein [Spirochaetota bacterium]HOL57540.1 hypothetical protein [Spirochaetota bacterium]HPP05076.1 hypothetical protein [Spirochaetota bacterium]
MFKRIVFLFCLIFINRINAIERIGYLNIIVGKNFNQKAKIGLFSFKTTPQIAFWLESEDETYKKTIYITKRFAKQEWQGAIYDKNKTFREYALPLWGKKFKENLPTKNNPLSDSITMASPTKDTKVKFSLPSDKTVILFLEVNNSFDYNEFYPEDRLYNGQPSLVYTAKIQPDFKGKVELILTYKTDLQGNLSKNLNDITTAKEILKRVEVEVE